MQFLVSYLGCSKPSKHQSLVQANPTVNQAKTMDPSAPAWLRSYKAQSAIIPNFASQVRPETNGPPIPNNKGLEATSSIGERDEWPKHLDTENAAAADAFAFPSTISLTLHNGSSLDKSYSDTTPTSSPPKLSFNQDTDENETTPEWANPLAINPSQRRRPRGALCRFFNAVRMLLTSKTQNTLAH